jgi:hypothetical protein
MADDGYLLIRGMQEREQVLAARRGILEDLERRSFLKPGAQLMDGVVKPDSDHVAINSAMSNRHLIRLPALLNLVEGVPQALQQVFEEIILRRISGNLMLFLDPILGAPASEFFAARDISQENTAP